MVFHKVDFKSVDLGDENGIVTIQVNCEIYEDETDGVLTATIKTAKAGIGQAAA